MLAVITGSTGLVGSRLAADLLTQGHTVRALCRSLRSAEKLRYILDSEGVATDNLTIVETNIEDFGELRASFAGADAVFHLAAVVDLSGEDVVAENVRLAELAVEACLAQERRPALLFTSSIAALDGTTQKSPYGVSKFLSENQIWRGAKQGLSVGVVAPAVVLGVGAPGSGGLQPVIKLARRGVPFYTSGATGFVDLRDVSRALILLATDEGMRGRNFLLCSQNDSFRHFIHALSGRNPWLYIPRWLFFAAAWVLRFVQRRPLLTSEMGGFMYAQNGYDGSEIVRASGGRFEYRPLEETYEWVVKTSEGL